jgi:hypothetical protein
MKLIYSLILPFFIVTFIFLNSPSVPEPPQFADSIIRDSSIARIHIDLTVVGDLMCHNEQLTAARMSDGSYSALASCR